jgi:hypothetical protein
MGPPGPLLGDEVRRAVSLFIHLFPLCTLRCFTYIFHTLSNDGAWSQRTVVIWRDSVNFCPRFDAAIARTQFRRHADTDRALRPERGTQISVPVSRFGLCFSSRQNYRTSSHRLQSPPRNGRSARTVWNIQFHSGKDFDVGFLDFNTAWTCKKTPGFRKNRPEDEGRMSFWNGGIYLQIHIAWQPRKPTSTLTSLRATFGSNP